jgi:hypothetical protein
VFERQRAPPRWQPSTAATEWQAQGRGLGGQVGQPFEQAALVLPALVALRYRRWWRSLPALVALLVPLVLLAGCCLRCHQRCRRASSAGALM